MMHETNGYTVGSAGTNSGPCTDPTCRAIGCRTAREIVATLCCVCEKPVGHDVHLVFARTSATLLTVAHHPCFEAAWLK